MRVVKGEGRRESVVERRVWAGGGRWASPLVVMVLAARLWYLCT